MKILSNKICVLMATEGEASELLLSSDKNITTKLPYPVYQFSKFNILITGIGKINATLATVWAVEQGAEKFINAGICGSLNDKLELFQVCYPSVVKDLDLIQWGSNDIVCENFENKSIGSVGKPLHGGDETELLKKQADLVDMEAYGIVSFLQKFQFPLKLIKCITDFCQKDGKSEIKKNLPQAAKILKEAVLKAVNE